MEKHCVGLEIAKQLKKSGWNKETEYLWIYHGDASGCRWELYRDSDWDDKGFIEQCYAPIATELLEEIPNKIESTYLSIIKMDKGTYVVQYCEEDNNTVKDFGDLSLPDALAKMWIYLKENKLI